MTLKNLCFGLIISLIGFSVAEAAQTTHVEDVEAITEIFGDGENLSAVILTYNKTISGESVSVDDFSVPNRTISCAYVSENKEKGKSALNGRYVVLELEPLPMVEQGIEAHSSEDRAKREEKGFHGPTLGSHGNPKPLPTFSAVVKQIGTIKNIDGKTYKKSSKSTKILWSIYMRILNKMVQS